MKTFLRMYNKQYDVPGEGGGGCVRGGGWGGVTKKVGLKSFGWHVLNFPAETMVCEKETVLEIGI